MEVLLASAIADYTPMLGRSPEQVEISRSRMHAFINLSRWSGARIGDVAVLRKDSLKRRSDGVWVLDFFAIKPRKRCIVPVPDALAQELLAVSPEVNTHKDHFFWAGSGTAETAAKDWHAKLSVVFKHAGWVENGKPKHCNPHMFRHSFAVLSFRMACLLSMSPRPFFRQNYGDNIRAPV